MRWDRQNTNEGLTISEDGVTLAWEDDFPCEFQPVWLGAQTSGRLRDGVFSWDFVIEEIADRQIGVGIMVDPPDWGFFGYLGSGCGVWAYDAYEGAIVTETKAMHANLPRLRDRGVVSVQLDLKRTNRCRFSVDGQDTPEIELPPGCMIVPAACLLRRGQTVTLGNTRA